MVATLGPVLVELTLGVLMPEEFVLVIDVRLDAMIATRNAAPRVVADAAIDVAVGVARRAIDSPSPTVAVAAVG